MFENFFLNKRKASVGPTITWSVALFIVVFLMIVFFIAYGFLFGERKVLEKLPVSDLSETNLNLFFTSDNLYSQNNFFYVLSYISEEGYSLEELIILWKSTQDPEYERKLKRELGNIFLENKNCFIFLIDGKEFFKNTNQKKGFGISEKTIYLLDDEVNLKFYFKKC